MPQVLVDALVRSFFLVSVSYHTVDKKCERRTLMKFNISCITGYCGTRSTDQNAAPVWTGSHVSLSHIPAQSWKPRTSISIFLACLRGREKVRTLLICLQRHDLRRFCEHEAEQVQLVERFLAIPGRLVVPRAVIRFRCRLFSSVRARRRWLYRWL